MAAQPGMAEGGLLVDEKEQAEWRELLRRTDEGGNDGADIYECEVFAKAMEEKYGRQFSDLAGAW